nr:reverse transcriptase domain-containing protein [Tanacetum cinerariifolium]
MKTNNPSPSVEKGIYTPLEFMRKLEMELWDLKVKGTDLASYTQRFQELALLCGRMFFEESDKIEKYVGGMHIFKCKAKRRLIQLDQGVAAYPNSDDSLD